ncbi:MAG: DUF4830 domain-containing protein [Oscillospiraceae bacterium]|nr:DUF4830 domain-containing protein [Oscillospiraceae bacterium]
MMVMTAKVNMKKILIALAAIAGVILALVLLLGGNDSTTPTAAGSVSGNDARVSFLQGHGWEVSTSPVESGQVRIPEKQTEVYERYNALQKSQGYDLTQYAGKTVMRYVYKVNNYEGSTQPVYATVLVYKNQIIGGDITDTAPKGTIQGFERVKSSAAEQIEETTVPVESTS